VYCCCCCCCCCFVSETLSVPTATNKPPPAIPNQQLPISSPTAALQLLHPNPTGFGCSLVLPPAHHPNVPRFPAATHQQHERLIIFGVVAVVPRRAAEGPPLAHLAVSKVLGAGVKKSVGGGGGRAGTPKAPPKDTPVTAQLPRMVGP
jgi:hypothetical protein